MHKGPGCIHTHIFLTLSCCFHFTGRCPNITRGSVLEKQRVSAADALQALVETTCSVVSVSADTEGFH